MASYDLGSRGICPHCNDPSRFEDVRFENGVQYHKSFRGQKLSRALDPVVGKSVVVTPVACSACGGVIVSLTSVIADGSSAVDTRVCFPFNSQRPIPPEVVRDTPDIAEDYAEAATVLQFSPKASAALSRRCLQAVLQEKGGAHQKNLSQQVDAVLPTLPTYIAYDLDAVRTTGNFAAHPIKATNTGEVVEVEPGEAEWNLEVLDLLFDFYYVQPLKGQQRWAKLDKKLSDAKKPPLKKP